MKNKKLWVSIFAGFLAAVMLLSLLVGLIPAAGAANLTSAKLEELKGEINDLKDERKELDQEMDALKAQISDNMTEMEKLIAEKNAIDQQIGLLNQQILNINEQISVYGLLIADKQDELDAAKARLEELREQNKERIRAMEEEGSLSYWSVLFKANSFSDLLDRLNMIEEIAEADQRRLEEMNKAAEEVAAAQADLESEKAELEVTKEELNEVQAALAVKREEADAVLVELNAKDEELDKLMAEAEEKDEELLAQIAKTEKEYNAEKNRLEEEERKRQEEEKRRQEEEEKKKQEEANKNNGSTGSIPSSSGWGMPCSYIMLTSPFGYRIHPIHGTYTFHSGVDLAGPQGTPIKASRSGTVTKATYDSASGYYVTINHGDGFSSSYLHMTHYIVKPGDKVQKGQIIGYMGSTGWSTGSHLHFSIYYNGTAQNPAAYLNF